MSEQAAPNKAPKFAVTKLDPQEVLNQYLAGKTSKQIAEENGITRQALQAWLLREDSQGWQVAQTVSAQEDLDEARDYRISLQARIETADREERERLNIALVCARDAEKSAQWRLERVCRRIYGQDAPPSSVIPIQINIGISRAEQQSGAAMDETSTQEIVINPK